MKWKWKNQSKLSLSKLIEKSFSDPMHIEHADYDLMIYV